MKILNKIWNSMKAIVLLVLTIALLIVGGLLATVGLTVVLIVALALGLVGTVAFLIFRKRLIRSMSESVTIYSEPVMIYEVDNHGDSHEQAKPLEALPPGNDAAE